MKKRWIILIAVIVLAAAAGGIYYYKQNAVTVSLNDVYQTQTAIIENINTKISGSAKIEVRDKVSIYLNVSQIVANVNVKEGDKVAAGDILVVYDIKSDYDDLQRKLYEAEIQLENARLNLLSIAQSADGNELLQYHSDVTTAKKNITDAEADLINAQKNITDADGSLNSLVIKIAQQQLALDNAKKTMDEAEALHKSGGLSTRAYDDAVLAYKNSAETMNDLTLQKDILEKTLATRITQLEFYELTLETRKTQLEYAQRKLDNSQNRLADEATLIQYSIQQNIITYNEITIEQIKADIEKLKDKSVSPVNGSVTSVNAFEGGTISKGVPVITISDAAGIIVKYEISEYDAPLIELGQKVQITTSALPGRMYHGTVVKIAEEALEKEDSSNNEVVVPIEISIDDLDDKLKIGYSVDVDVITEEVENVVSIPIRAVFAQNGTYYVYIIRDNTLILTEVSPGFYGDKTAEIKSGLSAGDVVIVNPEDVKLK